MLKDLRIKIIDGKEYMPVIHAECGGVAFYYLLQAIEENVSAQIIHAEYVFSEKNKALNGQPFFCDSCGFVGYCCTLITDRDIEKLRSIKK